MTAGGVATGAVAGILPAAGGIARDLPPLVNVCWDHGCDRSRRIRFAPQHWSASRALLQPPARFALRRARAHRQGHRAVRVGDR